MSNRWMPSLELKLSPEQFRQLPRSAAYDYTYHAGSAWLTPRPRYYHALLDLAPFRAEGPAPVALRPLSPDDWPALEWLFAEAFGEEVPFAALTPEDLREAASINLARTRTGGDGPLIADASLVATDNKGGLVGAILITLVPLKALTHWDCCIWDDPAPADAVERRWGRPHLTWVFVRPHRTGRGVGTALLQASVRALLARGFPELISTFMVGNASSQLWHWRMGFRLLSYPGSARLIDD